LDVVCKISPEWWKGRSFRQSTITYICKIYDLVATVVMFLEYLVSQRTSHKSTFTIVQTITLPQVELHVALIAITLLHVSIWPIRIYILPNHPHNNPSTTVNINCTLKHTQLNCFRSPREHITMPKVFGKEGYPSKNGIGFTTINKPADNRKSVAAIGDAYWRGGKLQTKPPGGGSLTGKEGYPSKNGAGFTTINKR
jgi:hypothetical protein